MNVILIAVIVLGVVGLVSAVVLFLASKKFAVWEDPRIKQVSEVLPQANCGGCGYPGCSGFASACVKAAEGGDLSGLNCAPVKPKSSRSIPARHRIAGTSANAMVIP